jgi:hypothetical protein
MNTKYCVARSGQEAAQVGKRSAWRSRSAAAFSSAIAVLLSGCASSLGAFYNRPVVEDNAEKAVSTISLSADRRTVVVVTDGNNRSRFCAEPPPDTALAISTQMTAEAEGAVKKGEIDANAKAKLDDQLKTAVSVLSKRTPALEAYRVGSYSLCQLHLNGALTTSEVSQHFKELTEKFFDSLPKVDGTDQAPSSTGAMPST